MSNGDCEQTGELGFRSLGQLLFAFVDDVILKASWNGRVSGQFHGKGTLALGHASEVGGIAEGVCQRDFCGDVGDPIAGVGIIDQSASGDHVTYDRTLVVLGAFDIAFHDRFEEHGA